MVLRVLRLGILTNETLEATRGHGEAQMPPKEAIQASKWATLCAQMSPAGHPVFRGARQDAIWDYLGQLWEPKRVTLYPQMGL